ncbi:MAG: type I secretion C-terminal target domain-containing protein, partial [Micavibrio aeruginosavorus]|nr:type I secretion C-terminal target domain-containing protein [Micavibrio aeruginosavorus]
INDITVANSGGVDTTVTVTPTTDVITIWSQRSGSAYEIDKIEFSDGFVTSFADYASWTAGTSGADTLTGTSADETMFGKDGADTIDGAGGADDIHGGAGNDSLTGGAGADLLHGGTGDDTLYGGDGLDTLYGGAGADIFVFEAASAYNNVDVVKDFSTGQGDVIDLSDLLGSYNPVNDAITDFVQITTSGSNSSLFVDRDGLASTYGFTQIATISGVTGLTDEAALVTSGNLLVA